MLTVLDTFAREAVRDRELVAQRASELTIV